MGKYHDGIVAFEDFLSASVYYRKVNYKLGEALTLKDLSEIYKWFGDYEIAIRYCKRAILIFKEIGNITKQTEAMVSLIDSILIVGKFDNDEVTSYLGQGTKIINCINSTAFLEGSCLQALIKSNYG